MARSGQGRVGRVMEMEEEDEDSNFLKKPQRSHSVSPELRARAQKTSAKDAGGVDTEQFRLAFEDYKPVTFTSGYDLEKGMMQIHAVLSATNEDWEKRVDQLKRFRGYIMAGGAEFKEFHSAMRYLDLSLQTSIKDLRSQVVREACIAISFMATMLGIKCERSAEMLLPTLILLIPNSARVMASSGVVAIRILLTFVHSHKLIPIIALDCIQSKSKEVRRACCEFITICLSTFPKAALERHVHTLRETLKKCLSDADSDARTLARQAYAAFALVFPGPARELFSELDVSKQRQLNEVSVGPASEHYSTSTPVYKAKSVMKSTTIDNFHAMRITPKPTPGFSVSAYRSISAVDTGAARRAKAKFMPVFRAPGAIMNATPRMNFERTGPLQSSLRKPTNVRHNFMQTQPLGHLIGGFDRLDLDASGDNDDLNFDQATQLVTDIPSIIALLGSSNWLTKRDGLLNLRQYFRQGKPLLPSELELLRSSFTRLITDPSTKLVGIVLDTLYDFVHIHNMQIGAWLYQLLTKLWHRQGTDSSPVIQTKLERLLVLIRESFPGDVQFQQVMRFLADISHSLAFKIKFVVLEYLVALIRTVPLRPEDFKNSSQTRLGINKIINWTNDSKAPVDVRNVCQTILVLLNQLNCSEFVKIIDEFEEDVHKMAIKVISSYTRRISATAEEAVKHLTPAKVATPTASAFERRVAASASSGIKPSPTADVQQFQKKGGGNDENFNPVNAAFIDGRGFSAMQHDKNVSLSPIPDNIQDNTVEQIHYLTTWSDRFVSSSRSKQRQLLNQLHCVLRVTKEDVWDEHFMTVLPLLYDLLHTSANDSDIISGTLVCFADLLRLRPVQMRQLPELIIVNLLEIQRNSSKAVTKACEECLKLVIQVFPCDVIVKILGPIISSQPPPENVAAVRFFSMMCQETENKRDLVATVPMIAPLLVSAYATSEESTMRKECVYGLIYLQLGVGEDLMDVYYRDLSDSKLRLMNVYLKRIVQE